MPGITKKCKLTECGKEFTPAKGAPHQLYCSGAHAIKGRNDARGATFDHATRDCAREDCKKKFVPNKSQNIFCSRTCATRSRNDANLGMRLRKLDEILKAQGIDLGELENAQIKQVRFWEQGYKDAEGKGQIQELAGIAFSPAWESGPEWPVVQPGPPVAVKAPKAKLTVRKGDAWRTAVVLPDMQIGFWRDPDSGKLVPTHDEAALSVARTLIREAAPDDVIMNGDNLDFPEFGRYRKTPTFAQTTQAAVNRATLLMGELRTDAPAARIVWLEGNHEVRLPNLLIDNAVAAYGLKRPGDKWPVMSVPNLCKVDDVGVEYVAGYPANDFWLNDNLRLIHGNHVNSRGATATRYLEDERVSVLYGHIHRRECVEKTRHTRYGPRTVLAASFGCLCRIDGAVPSTKGGSDLFGRPLAHAEDWQQGLGIVHYHPDGRFAIESVAIWNGWAMHRGQEFVA